MKIETVYRTEDGAIFDSKSDAESHVEKILGKSEIDFRKYLESNNGKSLLKKHTINEHGIWEIRGSDPNCDFGGYHHNPYLDTVECSLEKAIRHAGTLNGWIGWGYGGEIKKIVSKKI